MSRRVLISGTSRGIGDQLARHYLAQGDIVVGCARGDSSIVHERYTHVRTDVADEDAVRGLLRTVRDEVGGLDVLVNNAGAGGMNPVALTPAATARRLADTNFLGTFLLTQAALRL